MKRLGYRYQRTIGCSTDVVGVGFLTGATVRLRFRPAPPYSGVVFVRTDLKGCAQVPALVTRVTGTARRTTLGESPVQVGLVEHVLAALAGLKIDNCIVELNAPEPPGLDGSCQAFVDALFSAGPVRQGARRAIWAVEEPIVVSSRGATLALHPSEEKGLTISYFLDYGQGAAISRQNHTIELTPSSFMNQIAACRTFLLEAEAAELRNQGLGKHTTPRDLLVFGPRGPVDNTLRFANEPARHKILDVIGDISLLGADLHGHIVAYRSGHPLNVELTRTLHQELSGSRAEPRLAAA